MKIARTYRLTPATAKGVTDLAERYQIWASDLAEALLAHALAEVANGRLVLDVAPVVWEVRGVLHPAESSEFSALQRRGRE